jgi:hypothetical protein
MMSFLTRLCCPNDIANLAFNFRLNPSSIQRIRISGPYETMYHVSVLGTMSVLALLGVLQARASSIEAYAFTAAGQSFVCNICANRSSQQDDWEWVH